MRHVANKPVSEPVLYILMSLAEMPRHGYALIKDIETISEGRVRLSTGTLYGIIKRLLSEGLVRERGRAPRADDRRRSYELTAFGREVARAEAVRLEQTLAMARRKALFKT